MFQTSSAGGGLSASLASHHTETCNVVIFGETGAGKSSLINLVTKTQSAQTSCDAMGCTTKTNVYESDVLIQNKVLKVKLFDTVGLDEDSEGVVPAEEARRILKKLLRSLMERGDVHLIMYCVRGARERRALHRNYKLIHSQVRERIPIVLVVTGLEDQQPEMDDWWKNNEEFMSDLGMTFTGHACVTTLPIDEDAEDRLKQRHDQSYYAVCQLIEHCRSKRAQTAPSDVGQTLHSTPKIGGRTKHKIIVLFGETGVGKSSLVNLMAGKEIARTSPDAQRCTLHWTEHIIGFGGESYKVFDTIGLEEPQLGIKQYLESIENAYRLVKELDRQGGIDLLLFCIRAGRVTATLQSNYRLFHEFLCEKKVPIVLVITHLEREQTMEDWWKRQQSTFHQNMIHAAGHACIIAADRDGKYQHLYEESRVIIRNLVKEHTSDNQKQARIGGASLFISLMRKLKELLLGSPRVRRTDLVSRITKRCGISLEVATHLADMIKQDVRICSSTGPFR
ncbi:P-loop containing nucleoside triphosphate hydrolase protein [Suillus paluster]|uniref:P-loop containing nucleoside triphosphate hydrolase protein n=1 Tax=Suillus paluster TaxID=48578 RepID=UPI001B87D53F|nr:P-loop containing nucleoside triphosphate hydrolase protein [Suillus paluster]KAG1745353.1 P-loop containing nucleoside triphosphate hydrolase protein [Suillus paluster]